MKAFALAISTLALAGCASVYDPYPYYSGYGGYTNYGYPYSYDPYPYGYSYRPPAVIGGSIFYRSDDRHDRRDWRDRHDGREWRDHRGDLGDEARRHNETRRGEGRRGDGHRYDAPRRSGSNDDSRLARRHRDVPNAGSSDGP